MVKKRISLKVDKKKKKKQKTTRRKDEENILSKDIDIEEEMKDIEHIDDKPNRTSNLKFQNQNFIKNLKFKPQKYKGNFLPYHLRWILNNPIKTNEIVLFQEIEALEHEINRLKQKKLLNREHRRIANLPYGISSKPCFCCKKLQKRKHDCTHEFCEPNCQRKKAEMAQLQAQGNISKSILTKKLILKKKIFSSFSYPNNKPRIGLIANKPNNTPSNSNPDNPSSTLPNPQVNTSSPEKSSAVNEADQDSAEKKSLFNVVKEDK